ncbi:hypothetical protein [Spiroplasma endosymbiont of Othius punctulatus]|uniref:hypothetical protein n=1 Tax=Spiroplasma endosymbiont of Othius punctulatus TaxID=3066289 RepID=UPI0030D0BF21
MSNLISLFEEEVTKPEISSSTALIILIIGVFCIVACAVLMYFFVLHIRRVSAREKHNSEVFRRSFWWDEPMKFWSFYVYAFLGISLLLGFIICLVISTPFL